MTYIPCLLDDSDPVAFSVPELQDCGGVLAGASHAFTWTDANPPEGRIYRILVDNTINGATTQNNAINIQNLPTDGQQHEVILQYSDNNGDVFEQATVCNFTASNQTQVCDTVFDCASSIASFNFNNGVTTGLQCGQTLPISLDFVGCDGNRITSDFIGLSVSINGVASPSAVNFASSNPPALQNNYTLTVPNINGPATLVFQWGSQLDPEPCTITIPVEIVCNVGGPIGDHDTLVALQREFPGYGGEALNDAAVTSVYFMTNLNASGAGSMAGAPSGAYVVPLVAGKIVSNSVIQLPQSNVRFLGQLAPGHLSINGTTAFNSTELVRFRGNNALWEYFSIRASDINVGSALTGSHSPFGVFNGVNGSLNGMVLSHLSVHYGSDDNGAIFYDSQNVTFYRLLAAHGVTTSAFGGKRDNAWVIGGGSGRITLFQNLLSHSGRSPLIQESTPVQSANGLVYHTDNATTSNQIYGINTGGRPAVNQQTNFHDNLDIRFNGTASNVWTGQGGGSTLDLYANNNQYKDCAENYSNMGFTSSVPNVGNRNSPQHAMPALPAITDLTQLESFLLPRAGNYLCRDVLDQDVINAINACSVPAVEQTASDYFANPWPVGPTKPALTFWDQSSPDGLSDEVKISCGLDPNLNLLQPNDGRWEAVVDFASGGLLSASLN